MQKVMEKLIVFFAVYSTFSCVTVSVFVILKQNEYLAQYTCMYQIQLKGSFSQSQTINKADI